MLIISCQGREERDGTKCDKSSKPTLATSTLIITWPPPFLFVLCVCPSPTTSVFFLHGHFKFQSTSGESVRDEANKRYNSFRRAFHINDCSFLVIMDVIWYYCFVSSTSLYLKWKLKINISIVFCIKKSDEYSVITKEFFALWMIG